MAFFLIFNHINYAKNLRFLWENPSQRKYPEPLQYCHKAVAKN